MICFPFPGQVPTCEAIFFNLWHICLMWTVVDGWPPWSMCNTVCFRYYGCVHYSRYWGRRRVPGATSSKHTTLANGWVPYLTCFFVAIVFMHFSFQKSIMYLLDLNFAGLWCLTCFCVVVWNFAFMHFLFQNNMLRSLRIFSFIGPIRLQSIFTIRVAFVTTHEQLKLRSRSLDWSV